MTSRRNALPARLEPYRRKLYALTIKPERLQQIRNERRPESRYASRQQVQYELRTADALFSRYSIPVLDTTECSIEEIASRILNNTGIERRLRPLTTVCQSRIVTLARAAVVNLKNRTNLQALAWRQQIHSLSKPLAAATRAI